MPDHESTTEIDERPVTLTTGDGVALSGKWSIPRGQAAPSMAVIVACGAGIPARFYGRLARHVAARGAAILTFDYRGIGASRRGSLRRLASGMDDWAVRDLGAAIAEARRTYSNVPLGAIAHSVGAMLLGAATGADAIARSVFLGAHTGYWRDYNARWRLPLFVVWHALMPAVTHAVGYFPGSTFRLGEDLPRGVALDWARRRRPALIRTARDEARFGPYVERYAAFRAATLSISITDDAFAPPAAAERLLGMYPALDARREIVTPGDAGVPKLGHFGFIRRPAGEYFWQRSADWLLSASA